MSARLATAAALSASDREEAMAEVRQLITDLRDAAGRSVYFTLEAGQLRVTA